MKKLTILLFVLAACSGEDDPTFKVQQPFLQSRLDKFLEIAENHNVSVPRNNMILRFTDDDDTNFNNSRNYKDGDQLYIDIDKKFTEVHCPFEDQLQLVVFQQLANGLLGTPFRDCGLMRKVTGPDDIPADIQMDYGTYPNLFDSSSPCL